MIGDRLATASGGLFTIIEWSVIICRPVLGYWSATIVVLGLFATTANDQGQGANQSPIILEPNVRQSAVPLHARPSIFLDPPSDC